MAVFMHKVAIEDFLQALKSEQDTVRELMKLILVHGFFVGDGTR